MPRGARACARVGRGRPGLIRGCLSHTSRRYPDLLSGCRVVCRGDKHEKCAWHGVWRWHRAVKPRWLALQQTGHGGCIRAVRPIGARAGPCTGPEAIAGCVALLKAMALQQTGDGGCRRAVPPIGAHAGPCTGPEAIAGCVAFHKATDGLVCEPTVNDDRESRAFQYSGFEKT